MVSTLPRLPIFEAIASHDPQSTCVIHSASGRRFTYGDLLKDVADAKDKLVAEAGGKSIDGERIAFLIENSYDYVGAHTLYIPTMAFSG
jgi:malonyl-CoA/methylmalonyl-CoA synthetase